MLEICAEDRLGRLLQIMSDLLTRIEMQIQNPSSAKKTRRFGEAN